MTEKQKERYDNISLSLAVAKSKDTRPCTTPNCKNIFWIEDNKLDIVTCPMCKVKRCLSCDVDFNKGHEGITCADFQIQAKQKKSAQNDMPISE